MFLQSDYIYAIIKGSFAHRYRARIYLFTNFKVERNKDNYREISDCKLMLHFFPNTIVRVLEDDYVDILRQRFDLVDFEKLHLHMNNDSILTGNIINFIYIQVI